MSLFFDKGSKQIKQDKKKKKKKLVEIRTETRSSRKGTKTKQEKRSFWNDDGFLLSVAVATSIFRLHSQAQKVFVIEVRRLMEVSLGTNGTRQQLRSLVLAIMAESTRTRFRRQRSGRVDGRGGHAGGRIRIQAAAAQKADRASYLGAVRVFRRNGSSARESIAQMLRIFEGRLIARFLVFVRQEDLRTRLVQTAGLLGSLGPLLGRVRADRSRGVVREGWAETLEALN